MRKLSIFIFLIWAFNASGQKLTDLTFTGCLGFTQLQYSSVGTTQATATLGNAWALAEPTVNVANLSVSATFESNSTKYGKLVVPSVMPTDFSTPQLLYSQMFLKSDNSALAEWRKTNVTINKLTIASLPITVANPGLTQGGYSFIAEPLGTSPYGVQLNTNEHAIYFAFNASVFDFKFKLEHLASTLTSNGKIYVESSNDLSAWTSIQILDLPIYAISSQIDYRITNIASNVRYLRLRITGLENSRSIRKINLKSAQVNPFPTEGTPYTFEQMPAGWSVVGGGNIANSKNHYKHLDTSLKWDWVANSTLQVTTPVGSTTAGGMYWWVYNETPSTTPITFSLYKGSTLIKTFNYGINFKGWRAFWYSYSRDAGISNTANNPDKIVVKSSTTNTGTLYFDCVEFSNLLTWTEMNDMQISGLNQSPAVRDFLGIYNTPRPTTNVTPTSQQSADINTIAQRWEDWLLGTGSYSTDANMQTKMTKVNQYINSCKANYNSYNINKLPNGIVQGVGIYNDGVGYTPKFLDINQGCIMGLALDYRKNGSAESKDKALNIFDYFYDQGWAAGSAMGSIRLENLRYEGLFHSLFLMRNELKALGTVRYQQELNSMYWMALGGKLFQTGQPLGENTDDIRATFIGLLAYVLMENDPAKQLHAIEAMKNYVNNALAKTESDLDMIKMDGSGYHHEMSYNSEYATQGVYVGALYYYLFRNTQFALSNDSYNNLKLVLQKWNLMSSDHHIPVSTGGRFPNNDGALGVAFGASVYLALANPSDMEMKSLAKRTCSIDNEYIQASFVNNFSTAITHVNSIGALECILALNAQSVTAASEPQGADYMPFSGLLVSRQNDWLVSIKGFSNYIIDYECISPNNFMGKYLSNGHIQIWNEQQKLNSCSLNNSWDWSRFPGTTAKYLPMNLLKFDATRGDKERNVSDEKFLGGTVLNDSVSMFSNKIHDNANDLSFRVNKSNFVFGNTLVSLGTNITDTDTGYDIETTLFQDMQGTNPIVPKLNGTDVGVTTSVALTGSTNSIIKNSWGNSYIVHPYGGGSLEIRRQSQTTVNSDYVATPSNNYDVAYINHGKAPSNKGYRYLTVLGKTDAEVNTLAGASSPIEFLQQDNYAHVVRNNQLGITGYAVFASNATLSVGKLASTVRPVIAMIKENADDTLDIALSDPDMNRQSNGYPLDVNLSVTLNGSYRFISSVPNSTISIANNKTTITQVCRNGASYQYKIGPKLTQTISISGNYISKSTSDDDFTLATATSGLPITYSSSNTNVATIVSNKVHIVGAGFATITANQAGNADYNAATAVTQSLYVDQISIGKTATVNNIYQNNTNYNGARAVDGITTTRWATDDGVTGATLELDLGGVYSIGKVMLSDYSDRVTAFTISYWNGKIWQDAYIGNSISDLSTVSFPSFVGSKVKVSFTGTAISIYEFTVFGTPSKYAQTITFPTIGTKINGCADIDNATADSGLRVVYSSSNSAVATILDDTIIHVVGAGTTTITASQSGDASYAAATPVTQNLVVAENNIPLGPFGDSYVFDGSTSANYGLTGDMWIKNGGTNYTRKAYVQFKLAGNNISQIATVKLRLYATYVDVPGFTIKVSGAANNWTEGAITFLSKPITGATVGSFAVNAIGQYELDVTSYVNTQFLNGADSVSFVLEDSAASNKIIKFATKEAGTNKPELVITQSLNSSGFRIKSQPLSDKGNNKFKLNVYPNPVKDQLIITASNKNNPFKLNLYDINGRQLMSAIMTSDDYKFNTSSLPVGIYLLKVEDQESSKVFKVIKE